MRHCIHLSLVAVLLAGIGAHFGAGFVPAAEASSTKDGGKPKKQQSLRDRYALPSHIQMRPMMVPIIHPYQSVTPISLFLEAVDRKEVGAICKKVPRIRDAILRVLSRQPVPTRRGKLVLTGISDQLMGPINRALGETGVKSVHVEPGIVRLSDKGGVARLPFATINGCKGIKEIELEIVKEQQKQKEKDK